GDAIAIGLQRQVYFQGFFRLTQDFIIIEFGLIIIPILIIILTHGLFLLSCEIQKESNKPFFFNLYMPLWPILGLLRLRRRRSMTTTHCRKFMSDSLNRSCYRINIW